MPLQFDISLLPVFLAAIASAVLSTILPSKSAHNHLNSAFDNSEVVELTKEQLNKGNLKKIMRIPLAALMSFISELLTAYILAVIMLSAQIPTIASSILIALLVWLGFIIAMDFPNSILNKIPIKQYLVSNYPSLLSLILMAVILSYWII